MNKETMQAVADDLVDDIKGVISSQPKKNTCVWWRGRIDGVLDTVNAISDDVDWSQVYEALEALRETEDLTDA